jgi:hypothetical protein
MKKSALIQYLEREADRFKTKAKDAALSALHKSPEGRSINEQDARLIRDHEIRSETYLAAASIAAGHNV